MKPITIVVTTTVLHELTKFSIEKTLENTPHVEDVIVFADKPIVDYGTFIPIRKNFNYADYNYIMLKGLSPFIKTDFILHIHPDGMAANKELWTDEFLKYDYVGAPWHDQVVGNGGFSLRSFKLIDALLDSDVIAHWIETQKRYVNEDHVICRYQSRFLYDKYGIKIAPFELAKYFSKEMNPFFVEKTFGFHGTWIMPHFFDRQTIEKVMINYYSDPKKKMLWETFLQKTYSEGYKAAFSYLEVTCDQTGLRLWG
jgi:hypothetical protein